MSFTSEFREFAMKGNVVDLAVGVIIGGGFGKIVDSLVGDIVMPILGRLVGNLDFGNLFAVLKDPNTPPAAQTVDAIRKAGGVVLAYGSFITVAVNFVLLALVIFLMVRQMNRMKKAEPPAPAPAPVATPEDIVLLREIRDSLRRS